MWGELLTAASCFEDGERLIEVLSRIPDGLLREIHPHHPVFACRSPDGMEALLRHGSDPNAVFGRSGETPLACCMGRRHDASIARVLLAHGADPFAGKGWNAAEYALRKGSGAAIQVLLQWNRDVMARYLISKCDRALDNYKHAHDVWPILHRLDPSVVTEERLRKGFEYAAGDSDYFSVPAALIALWGDDDTIPQTLMTPIIRTAITPYLLRQWSPRIHRYLDLWFRERTFCALLVLNGVPQMDAPMRCYIVQMIALAEWNAWSDLQRIELHNRLMESLEDDDDTTSTSSESEEQIVY